MLTLPAGSTRVFTYDYPNVLLDGDLSLPFLRGKSECSRTPQGLVITTTLATQIEVECGRCLTPFSLPVQTEFTELFVFYFNRDRSPEDLVLPEDGFVDLGPIAREQLLLEVPINPLCKPDCKGLCSTCGVNRNEEDCGHDQDFIDPRLAGLQKLLGDS